jgi:hypothetical protein
MTGRSIVGAFLITFTLFGQEAAAPAFEVSSVKPSSDQDFVVGMFTYPGGFSAARIGRRPIGTTSRPSLRHPLYRASGFRQPSRVHRMRRCAGCFRRCWQIVSS